MINFKYIHQNGGGLEKTVTTGPTTTWEAWCRLVAALEAKAELAERNGLAGDSQVLAQQHDREPDMGLACLVAQW